MFTGDVEHGVNADVDSGNIRSVSTTMFAAPQQPFVDSAAHPLAMLRDIVDWEDAVAYAEGDHRPSELISIEPEAEADTDGLRLTFIRAHNNAPSKSLRETSRSVTSHFDEAPETSSPIMVGRALAKRVKRQT